MLHHRENSLKWSHWVPILTLRATGMPRSVLPHRRRYTNTGFPPDIDTALAKENVSVTYSHHRIGPHVGSEYAAPIRSPTKQEPGPKKASAPASRPLNESVSDCVSRVGS